MYYTTQDVGDSMAKYLEGSEGVVKIKDGYAYKYFKDLKQLEAKKNKIQALTKIDIEGFIMPEELLFKLTCITGILFFILSIEFFCHIYKYNKQKKDMLVSKMTIFCPNCGIKFNKEQTDWVYDKNNIHVVAFVLSALGLFLGVFLTIPGLILSILSLQKINKGELPSKNKGLTISGIILSSLRIIITIYRIVQLTYIWN